MADAIRAGRSRLKRRESASSNTYSEISERSVKRRKGCIDYPKGKSKPTCLIHVPVHLSYEWNFMRDFCSNYVKSWSTKYRRHDPIPKKKFKRYQENNAIVNIAVDKILLH